jgi:hypothetical protein
MEEIGQIEKYLILMAYEKKLGERGRNGRESMTNQRVGAEKLDFQRGICIQYHQQTMQKKTQSR